MRGMLITGGAGFIGSNFVHYWHEHHPADRLVVVDALTYAGNLSNLEAVLDCDVRFVHQDIGDTEKMERLMRDESIDTIVHFAAESHVDRSIRGPELFVQTNIVGTHSLLIAARAAWQGGARDVRRVFHHVSTDEVYGSLGPDAPPFTEETAYAPNSPYAASKASSDHLVRSYHHTFGLPTIISNCSNNYGPFQFPEKFIPLMVVNALRGLPLPVYGDGLNVRDWLHVVDHCRGIELALERGKPGECYNLGGQCERANLDVVRTICSLLDELFRERPDLAVRFPDCPAAQGARVEELLTFVADRPGHDRRYAVDTCKANRELGYEPRVGFVDGLRGTLEWYVEHEAWWLQILDGSYRDWISVHYPVLAAAPMRPA